MSIIPKLSSSLGLRDEGPNVALAEIIAGAKDENAVAELITHLADMCTAIQQDCIKVLYEVGEREPALMVPHTEVFMNLLVGKNNRLQWGSMTALNCIAKVAPERIYKVLPKILKTADSGSVITRDQAVNILINLATVPEYNTDMMELLLEQLSHCPTNQLPMYAERALPVIVDESKYACIELLTLRLETMEKESQRKRIEKVIKKLKKQDLNLN